MYSFSANSWTPTATADTSALANNTYMGIKGGSATATYKVNEIYMGGEASASSLNIMNYARASTIETTPTALTTKASNVGLNFTSSAVTSVGYVAAAAGQQRDVAGHLLDLSFNSFGGIVRWVAAPGAELWIIGNTVALGGVMGLSGFTGATSGAMSAHLIYEQV